MKLKELRLCGFVDNNDSRYIINQLVSIYYELCEKHTQKIVDDAIDIFAEEYFIKKISSKTKYLKASLEKIIASNKIMSDEPNVITKKDSDTNSAIWDELKNL